MKKKNKKRMIHRKNKLRATEKIFLFLAIVFAFTILSFSNWEAEDKLESNWLGRILEILRLELSETLTKGNLITGAVTESNPGLVTNSIPGEAIFTAPIVSSLKMMILMIIAIALIILGVGSVSSLLKGKFSGKIKQEEKVIRKEIGLKKRFKEERIKPAIIETKTIIPKTVTQEIKPVLEWTRRCNLNLSEELEQINQKIRSIDSSEVRSR